MLTGLTRLNVKYTGKELSDITRRSLRSRVNSLLKDKIVKPPAGGDDAVILDDIYRMICAMDPRDKKLLPLLHSSSSLFRLPPVEDPVIK